MKNTFTLTVMLILCLTASCFSQDKRYIQVHLKNGSVLKGKLLQEQPEVKIEMFDKSIFSFQPDEIERIEDVKYVSPNVRYKKKGFVHYTELGPLAMSNRASNGVTTSAFSFQTTNGYKFNQWVYAGLGVGADLYAVQTFVPVVLSMRGDFIQKGDKLPFYFVEAGHGFNATSNDVDSVRFGGGATVAAGIGLKILFSNNTGFVISAGYRFQRSSVQVLGIEKKEDFNRLTLRAGFSF